MQHASAAPPSPGNSPKPVRKRRRDAAKRLMRKLRERREQRRLTRATLGKRMRKRKAALALSAGAMSLSTGAMPAPSLAPDPMAVVQIAENDNIRKPAALLSVSDSLKEAMIQEEGVRKTVYRDVAGYPTVGVGHLVKSGDGLRVGDRISDEQVLDFLEQDLKVAEAAVERLVGDLKLYQHEFDALVDLVYNVGEGNVSERESPRLNEAIATGDHDAIAAELDYYAAGGSRAKGLIYRSERRTNIFLDANYDDTRPGIYDRQDVSA